MDAIFARLIGPLMNYFFLFFLIFLVESGFSLFLFFSCFKLPSADIVFFVLTFVQVFYFLVALILVLCNPAFNIRLYISVRLSQTLRILPIPSLLPHSRTQFFQTNKLT